MKYSKSAIGLLTAQYRSVLKKCWMINVGLFALLGATFATPAEAAGTTVIVSGLNSNMKDGAGELVTGTQAGTIDLSTYALMSDLTNFVTNSSLNTTLNNYATKDYLINENNGLLKNYVKSETLNGYVETGDLETATVQKAAQDGAGNNIVNTYLTKSDATATYAKLTDLNTYAKSADITDMLTKTEASSTYAQKTVVDGLIAGTTGFNNVLIGTAPANGATLTYTGSALAVNKALEVSEGLTIKNGTYQGVLSADADGVTATNFKAGSLKLGSSTTPISSVESTLAGGANAVATSAAVKTYADGLQTEVLNGTKTFSALKMSGGTVDGIATTVSSTSDNTKLATAQAVYSAVNTAKTEVDTAAQGYVTALRNGAVKDNADAIADLKDASKDGSIAKTIQANASAATYTASSNTATIGGAIKANADAIETLGKGADEGGSILNSIKTNASDADYKSTSAAGTIGGAIKANTDATSANTTKLAGITGTVTGAISAAQHGTAGEDLVIGDTAKTVQVGDGLFIDNEGNTSTLTAVNGTKITKLTLDGNNQIALGSDVGGTMQGLTINGIGENMIVSIDDGIAAQKVEFNKGVMTAAGADVNSLTLGTSNRVVNDVDQGATDYSTTAGDTSTLATTATVNKSVSGIATQLTGFATKTEVHGTATTDVVLGEAAKSVTLGRIDDSTSQSGILVNTGLGSGTTTKDITLKVKDGDGETDVIVAKDSIKLGKVASSSFDGVEYKAAAGTNPSEIILGNGTKWVKASDGNLTAIGNISATGTTEGTGTITGTHLVANTDLKVGTSGAMTGVNTGAAVVDQDASANIFASEKTVWTALSNSKAYTPAAGSVVYSGVTTVAGGLDAAGAAIDTLNGTGDGSVAKSIQDNAASATYSSTQTIADAIASKADTSSLGTVAALYVATPLTIDEPTDDEIKAWATTNAANVANVGTTFDVLQKKLNNVHSDLMDGGNNDFSIAHALGGTAATDTLQSVIEGIAVNSPFDATATYDAGSIGAQVKTNTSGLTKLNGTVGTEGSVLNSIQANAKDATFSGSGDDRVTIAEAIQANADAIDAEHLVVEGTADKTVVNAIAKAKADAQQNATDQITALTNDLASATGTTVVDGAHITDGTITTAKIKDKNITWAKLSNGVQDTIKNNEKVLDAENLVVASTETNPTVQKAIDYAIANAGTASDDKYVAKTYLDNTKSGVVVGATAGSENVKTYAKSGEYKESAVEVGGAQIKLGTTVNNGASGTAYAGLVLTNDSKTATFVDGDNSVEIASGDITATGDITAANFSTDGNIESTAGKLILGAQELTADKIVAYDGYETRIAANTTAIDAANLDVASGAAKTVTNAIAKAKDDAATDAQNRVDTLANGAVAANTSAIATKYNFNSIVKGANEAAPTATTQVYSKIATDEAISNNVVKKSPGTWQYMKAVLSNPALQDKAISAGAMGQFVQEIGYNMKQDQLGWDINVDTSSDDSFAKKLTSNLYADLKYDETTNTTDRTVVSALNVAGDAIETLNGDSSTAGSVQNSIKNRVKLADGETWSDSADTGTQVYSVAATDAAIEAAASDASEALDDVLNGKTAFNKVNVGGAWSLVKNSGGNLSIRSSNGENSAIFANNSMSLLDSSEGAGKEYFSVSNSGGLNLKKGGETDPYFHVQNNGNIESKGTLTLKDASAQSAQILTAAKIKQITDNADHIGDMDSLRGDDNAMMDYSGTTAAPATTLVQAANNLSATLGTIHGLKAKVAANENAWYANGAGNLYAGSSVEDHLTELAASVGKRDGFLTGYFTKDPTGAATTLSAADAILNMDAAVFAATGNLDFTSGVNYIQSGDNITQALKHVDGAIKTVADDYVTKEYFNGGDDTNNVISMGDGAKTITVGHVADSTSATNKDGSTFTVDNVNGKISANVYTDEDRATTDVEVSKDGLKVASTTTSGATATTKKVVIASGDVTADGTVKGDKLEATTSLTLGTSTPVTSVDDGTTVVTDTADAATLASAKTVYTALDAAKTDATNKITALTDDLASATGTTVVDGAHITDGTITHTKIGDGEVYWANLSGGVRDKINSKKVTISTQRVGNTDGVQVMKVEDGTNAGTTLTLVGANTIFEAKQEWLDKALGIHSGDYAPEDVTKAELTGTNYLTEAASFTDAFKKLDAALGGVADGYVTKDYFNGKDGATVQMGIESDDVQVGKQNYSGTTPVSLMSGIRIFKDTSGTSTDRVITIGSNNADANDFKGIKISENGQTVSMGSLDNANAKIVTVKDGNVTADGTVQATKLALSNGAATPTITEATAIDNTGAVLTAAPADGKTLASTLTVYNNLKVDAATKGNYAAGTVKTAVADIDLKIGDRNFANTNYAKLDNASYELTKAITNLDTALYTVAGDYVSKTYFNNGEAGKISMGSGADVIEIGKTGTNGVNGIVITDADSSIRLGDGAKKVMVTAGDVTADGKVKGTNLEATTGLTLAGSEVTSIADGSALSYASAAADADKKVLASNATVINTVKALADGAVAANTARFGAGANLRAFNDGETVADYMYANAKDSSYSGSTTIAQAINANTTRLNKLFWSETSDILRNDAVGTNGKGIIFNETDGGGAKFEHTDGTYSAVAVNDGGANGIAAQIYAVNNGTKEGSRIDVTKNGIYYTVGSASAADRDVKANEIVTYGTAKDGIYSVDAATGDETTIAEAIAATEDRFGAGVNLRAFNDGETVADYVDALAETATFTPDATAPADSLDGATTIGAAINNVAGAVDLNTAAIGDRTILNGTHYANPGTSATTTDLSQAIKNMDDNIYAKLGDVDFAAGMNYVEAGDTVTGAITHLDTKVAAAISGLDDKYVTKLYFNGGDDTNHLISMGGDASKIWIGKQSYTSGGDPEELKTGIEVDTTNKAVSVMADANNGLTVSTSSVGVSLNDSGINTVITANKDGTIALGTKSGTNVTGIAMSDKGSTVTFNGASEKVVIADGVVTADDSVVVGNKAGTEYVEIEEDKATFKGATGTVTIADGTVTAKKFAFSETAYATGIDNVGGVFTAAPTDNYTIATTRTVYDNTTVADAANGNYAAGSVIAALGSIDTAIGNRTYTNPNFLTSGESITSSLTALDTAIGEISDDYVTWDYFNNGEAATLPDSSANPNAGLVSMGSGAKNVLIGKTITNSDTGVTSLKAGLAVNNATGNVMLGKVTQVTDTTTGAVTDVVETGVNIEGEHVSLYSANGLNSVNGIDVDKTTVKMGIITTDTSGNEKFAGFTLNNGVMTNVNADTPAKKSILSSDALAITDGTNTSSVAASGMAVTNGTDTTLVAAGAISASDGTNTASMDKTGVAVTDGANTSSMAATGIAVTNGTDTTLVAAGAISASDGTNTASMDKTGFAVTDTDNTTTVAADGMTVSADGGKIAAYKADVMSISDGTHTTTINSTSVTTDKVDTKELKLGDYSATSIDQGSVLDPSTTITAEDKAILATNATVKASINGVVADIEGQIHGDTTTHKNIKLGDLAETTTIGKTTDSLSDPLNTNIVVDAVNNQIKMDASDINAKTSTDLVLDNKTNTITIASANGDKKTSTGLNIVNDDTNGSHDIELAYNKKTDDVTAHDGLKIDADTHTISLGSSNTDAAGTKTAGLNMDAATNTFTLGATNTPTSGDATSYAMTMDATNGITKFEDQDGKGVTMNKGDMTVTDSATVGSETGGVLTGVKLDKDGNAQASNSVLAGTEDATSGELTGAKLSKDGTVQASASATVGQVDDQGALDGNGVQLKNDGSADFVSANGEVNIADGSIEADHKVTADEIEAKTRFYVGDPAGAITAMYQTGIVSKADDNNQSTYGTAGMWTKAGDNVSTLGGTGLSVTDGTATAGVGATGLSAEKGDQKAYYSNDGIWIENTTAKHANLNEAGLGLADGSKSASYGIDGLYVTDGTDSSAVGPSGIYTTRDMYAEGAMNGKDLVARESFTLAGATVHSIDNSDAKIADFSEDAGSIDELATTASIYYNAEDSLYTPESGTYVTAGADTINEALTAVDNIIGDFPAGLNKDLVDPTKTSSNLTNGGKLEPATILDAFNNIDATMGTIHGLAAKRGADYKGNLADGTTIEMHLSALDDSIGDRTTITNEKGSNGYAFSTETMYVADVLTDLASQIGTADELKAASFNGVSEKNTVNANIAAINSSIGDVSELQNTTYAQGGTVVESIQNVDNKLQNLDTRMESAERDLKDVHHELRRGMASMAAMSALVPNSRSTGKTSLSLGTGAYSGHNAVAVGGFHYLTDNLMLNAGAAWSNSRDAVYRVGVTYSF